jgi:drug/metabolite transporter (DMT)-like permease
MINYILAAMAGVFATSQSTFTKLAPRVIGKSKIMRFNVMKVGAAFAVFTLIFIWKMQLHLPSFLYAGVYGASQFFSTLFGFLALASGSLALTSTIVSYSVVIPCIFGIVFLDERIGVINGIGFLLLLLSIFLLKKPSDGKKFSKEWLVYVAITFCCNGISSIVQKLHQTAYPGSYQGEFMIFSMLVSLLLFVIIWLVSGKESGDGVCHAKFAIPAGVLMGFNNFLTLSLASKFNASVLFPTVSVFQTVFNIVFSKIFFKEKLSPRQIIGILIGVVSVILIK